MLEALKRRESRLNAATSQRFDLIVIGGGIHGACVAQNAALRGLQVLLIEANDFSSGTSSRSSKLLHGGVRYLEQGNVPLVFEALHERRTMLRLAPHLTRPLDFLFPVIPKKTRPWWQVKFGLFLYQLIAGERMEMQKQMLTRNAQTLKQLGLEFTSLIGYSDAQMDDARIVIEHLLDAEELGAVCLNYTRAIDISRLPDETRSSSEGGRSDRFRLKCRCRVTGRDFECSSSAVANLTGPWVVETHKLFGQWPAEWPTATWSRGTHLLFRTKLEIPGLILPTGERGRYYFVLPYFSPREQMTLVGTTDRELSANEANPRPEQSEIDELLGFLARDLPQSELNRDTMYQVFAGVRSLVESKGSKPVSEESRSDVILYDNGYITMLGGKYTTARSTAEKIVKRLEQSFAVRPRSDTTSTKARVLPGGRGWSEDTETELIREIGKRLEGSESRANQNSSQREECIRASVRRFASRAALLEKYAGDDDCFLGDGYQQVIRSEVRLAVLDEQAWTLDDLLWRRLGLAYLPGVEERHLEIESELHELVGNLPLTHPV